MRSRFTVLTVLVAMSLIGAGCATTEWVRDLMEKERGKTDSQMVEVKGRVGTEAKRVDEAVARVSDIERSVEVVNRSVEGVGRSVEVVNRSVEGVNRSVEQVSRSTQAAQERADAAFSRAEQSDQRLTRLWAKRNEVQQVEAMEVLFKFDRADLDDGAQTTLLGVVRLLKGNQNLTVDLVGYADPVGTQEANVQLSQRRVEAVRRFLVQQGIELSRINSVGLGVLSEAGIPDDKKRNVIVRLMVAVAQ